MPRNVERAITAVSLVCAVIVSAFLFARGYASHRKRRYLAALAISVALFIAGHLSGDATRERVWSGTSSLLLVGAQIGNRRRTASCACTGHGCESRVGE